MDEFLNIVGSNQESEVGMCKTEACVPICQPTLTPKINNNIFTQWSKLSDNRYCVCTETVNILPADIYTIQNSEDIGIHFSKLNLVTDDLIELPSTEIDVLTSIQKFWESKSKFVKRGQLFKRGMLLWGPPGSGKTITVTFLAKDLIKRNGIVLVCTNPELISRAMVQLRKVEPERPIICILEDIDEIINRFGEPVLLSLLDGENQINNVVYVATTNYPERLDPRIINRPSRFDEIIKIGMPTDEVRSIYLKSKLFENEISDDVIEKWVKDTEGLSIAHLKELIVAITCLDRDYNETIKRLQNMKKIPASTGKHIVGF